MNKLLLSLAAILVVIGVFFCFKACNNHTEIKAEKKEQQLEKVRHVDTTSHWKDDYNREHALRTNAEGTLQQLKGVYQDMLTKKTKELGINERQIQGITNFSILHDTLARVYHVDTSYSFNHDTVYINSFTVEMNSPKDSLSVLQYLKKTGWFSHTPYIDIVDYTPGAHVENISGFKISAGKTSWVSVGPAGALIYTGNKQFTPAAGVGVVIRVWKIPISLSILKAF